MEQFDILFEEIYMKCKNKRTCLSSSTRSGSTHKRRKEKENFQAKIWPYGKSKLTQLKVHDFLLVLESVQRDFQLKVISFALFQKLASKLSNGKHRRLIGKRGKVVRATSFRSRNIEKQERRKERKKHAEVQGKSNIT